MEKHTVIHFI
ncbi:UNVERIFIED_CONTAM: hypothetical protein GTU68_020427 [Idotea baltica]|nr:hypothetical protein [Idotea baltica]